MLDRDAAVSAPHRTNRFHAPQSSPPMVLTLLLVATGLCGCVPKPPQLSQPETSPARATQQTEMGASRFGSFNLNKRHGLGGWQGNSQTSQHQWLRQIQDANGTPNPAASQPVSSGL